MRNALLYLRALRAVNEIRRERGMGRIWRLPKGLPGSAYSCPIARATGLLTSNAAMGPPCDGSGGPRRETPPAIAEFVQAFDSRRFPNIIDSPEGQ